MSRETSWTRELEGWLAPFLEALSHKKQRLWAPVYVEGLLRPGRRKSVEPMAERVAPGEVQQVHNFVSTSRWDPSPLLEVLAQKGQALEGGPKAHLIVDDTALVKKGRHSVGVAHQYCGELGKKANCQTLVSLTLARDEVPVALALRLFLPQCWAKDPERRSRAYVPDEVVHQPKWKIALEEIDRVIEQGVEFGDVLADAGYGMGIEFRQGLSKRKLRWAVGILPNQKVYRADVRLKAVRPGAMGRPRKHREPTSASVSAEAMIESLGPGGFRAVSWRRGTKGKLQARFACVRVRVADGEKGAQGRRGPGEELWLIAEHRQTGERKYYLSNLPASATRKQLAATLKARWVCEQGHQQMKQELGLDHFEGRSWHGLHHHALLVMIAYAFGQHLRLKGKKTNRRRRSTSTQSTGHSASTRRHTAKPDPLPPLQMHLHLSP
jgi:SRSO17 transposase